jgi:hypothetical protein
MVELMVSVVLAVLVVYRKCLGNKGSIMHIGRQQDSRQQDSRQQTVNSRQ